MKRQQALRHAMPSAFAPLVTPGAARVEWANANETVTGNSRPIRSIVADLGDVCSSLNSRGQGVGQPCSLTDAPIPVVRDSRRFYGSQWFICRPVGPAMRIGSLANSRRWLERDQSGDAASLRTTLNTHKLWEQKVTVLAAIVPPIPTYCDTTASLRLCRSINGFRHGSFRLGERWCCCPSVREHPGDFNF